MLFGIVLGALFVLGFVVTLILAKPQEAARKLTAMEEAAYEVKPATAEEIVYDARNYILDGCKGKSE